MDSPLEYFNKLMAEDDNTNQQETHQMSYQDEERRSNNTSLHAHEVEEFRAWQLERIRAEERSKAQAEAAHVNLAAEEAADRAALAALEARGVTDVAECFGATSTPRGRNAIQVIYQLGQGAGTQRHYARLRRMAAARGLCK
jgi:hypothetical protein